MPDRTVITGVAKNESSKLNPENALVRMQFIELLFRIANEKYRRPDIVKTYSAAFVKLMEDHILPNWKMEVAQDFRDQEYWTQEVNDLYKHNMESLKKLYDHYADAKKYMYIDDAVNMCTRHSDLILAQKDAMYLYAMSKMTIVHETENAIRYFRTRFVEMLEYIARIAKFKFKNSNLESLPLVKKIEYILDELFRIINTRRVD
eukprot:CAMPEP_0176352262 /NCGR_PEP_ID=MMETSP0126-20121128/10882_1 /TAXON_ID=141414 ORGANISM="Strombidinopsis acuminatum, Strain SPMC142" /NCGR_SAMPLE_ID=MMETSP0126 /ASSEMBLY_ACC=CAM_ASM_000229 /LENGTH=203 /DNA_ID=CAMNT_0017703263 /DNA_START=114 /DNA_END=725 /DNA_ORIENTATION=+